MSGGGSGARGGRRERGRDRSPRSRDPGGATALGSPRIDRICLAGLIGLVALTPWPLGSRLPWAGMIAASAALLLATLWLLDAAVRARRLELRMALLPAAGFLAWAGLQWLQGWTVYDHGTAYEWVRWASYAAVFFLALQLATRPPHAARLTRAVFLTGIAVGLFGLVQFLTWNGYLYWLYEPPYEGTRFGPFNNRNYFAGYMVVALAPALALIATGGLRRARAWITWGTAVAFLAAAISLSRGGTVALFGALGLVVWIGLAPVPGEGRGRAGRRPRSGSARGHRRRRGTSGGDARTRWQRGVRLGALAAWVGTLVYAVTDFPTIIPAIDYALAVLAAVGVADFHSGSSGATRQGASPAENRVDL